MSGTAVSRPRAVFGQDGTNYQQRTTNIVSLIREEPSPYESRTNGQQPTSNQPLSEAALSHLWAGQRFPASALRTRGGTPVRVLHPGRAGRGAGPDYRDAIIAAPGGPTLRGDVELHVRASDFRAHGHARDPAYNRVVLHVVFEDDTAEDTRLANGRAAPVVALAPWLHRRAQELAGWMTSPRLWCEPCHDAVARLGQPEVLRVLGAFGDRRFGARCAALAEDVAAHGPAESLYRALLSALGYGGDRRPFENLAERLPFAVLAGVMDGIAPERHTATVENVLLQHAGLSPGVQSRGRPANHPARRLAGMARLLARHRAVFQDPCVLDVETPGGLVAAWCVAPLIGRSRAIELLTNAVLPWAVACADASGDRKRAESVRRCFAMLPRPGRYGALAFLETNLRDGETPLRLDARAQQGLLELYKTECTQGGCGRCALS